MRSKGDVRWKDIVRPQNNRSHPFFVFLWPVFVWFCYVVSLKLKVLWLEKRIRSEHIPNQMPGGKDISLGMLLVFTQRTLASSLPPAQQTMTHTADARKIKRPQQAKKATSLPRLRSRAAPAPLLLLLVFLSPPRSPLRLQTPFPPR